MKIIIIGAGPAGLMAATQLLDAGVEIILVDQKPAPGRKFLVAGHGGFNLTHSEELEPFLEKYDAEYIRECVRLFTPTDFRSWLSSIGIETFIGSSGKVFPVAPTKPIEVLNAWLKVLDVPALSWKLKTRLIDFDKKTVTLVKDKQEEVVKYDYLIFACGGGSWKKTGSDGKWKALFKKKEIPVKNFESGNSGVELEETDWIADHEGAVIKNIRVTTGETTTAGDLVVTTYGLEGKPVYAANRWLRNNQFKGLQIDFKPQLEEQHIAEVLRNSQNVKNALEKLKIPGVVKAWLRSEVPKDLFTHPDALASIIKQFEPGVKGLRPLDEVISTAGGVTMDAISENGRLAAFPKIYCAGEMLDWDAPTGGYLLQACVSSGFVTGKAIAGLVK